MVPWISHAWTLALAAAAGSTVPPRHAAPLPEVTVVTSEYAFTMPDTLAAGPTTFRVENRGHELHHVMLVRLERGKTAADLVSAMKAGGAFPSWAVPVGGPNGVDPMGTSLATTVQLRPGHYAAICVIPSPDGVPHAMKGMARDLDVIPAKAVVSPASFDRHAGPTVTLVDYGFQPSAAIDARTRHLIVTNAGQQPHELELAKLAPGKTLRDLATWIERMDGPPPARFLGGVSPLAPGETNELDLALAPGHYLLLCLIPDVKDGKPHLAHGMARELDVR